MRTARLLTICGLSLALAVISSGRMSFAQDTPKGAALANVPASDDKVIADFQNRVKQYLDVVQKANSGMPKDKPRQDIDSLVHRRAALAASVKGLRASARQGDIFSPEAQTLFRKLIAETMKGPNGAKILASMRHAEPVPSTGIKLNESYPSSKGVPLQSTPPSLLLNLPVLPKGIEYRVVDHALLLRDTEANIVVDYIPDVFPKG